MSDNEKIYIQLEPEKKDSGFGALVMAAIAVGCLVAAVALIETVVFSVLLVIAAIIFAWIGMFMCQKIRKRGGSLPYSRTIATLGYIVCMLIIIASIAVGACVASIGGCLCKVAEEISSSATIIGG